MAQGSSQSEAAIEWSEKTPYPENALDAVVGIVEREFFDDALLQRLEWRVRADSLRSSLREAGSDTQVAAILKSLINELGTSHTELMTRDEFRYYITLDTLRGAKGTATYVAENFWGTGPYFPGIGAFTTEISGKHFIDGVLEGSPAESAGLLYGDEILAVDGQPYSPIAAFREKIGTTVSLGIRRRLDAQVEQLTVPVVPIVPSTAFAAATEESVRVIQHEGQRIGYIHLWSVNEARSFQAAIRSLVQGGGAEARQLDSLIIDLRGRVGGNIGSASQILDHLGEASKPYWGEERRTRRGKSLPSMALPTAVSTVTQKFAGRTALLVDHQTRSAGELLAYGYQRNSFGPIFGSRTAGAVAGGAPWIIPGDSLLYVASSSLEVDGKRLEGVGVEPDHIVERPLEYAEGQDPVLAAALDHLAREPQ